MAVLTVLTACGSGVSAGPAGSAPAGGPTSSSAPTAPGASSPTAGSSQTPVPVESNPPGDIPDNLAFVPYSSSAGGYSFTHPEGWAQSEDGASVLFTDKLNSVRADTAAIPAPLDVATVEAQEVPRLEAEQPAFELVSVEDATLPAGGAVKVTYRANSAPDPVTGRQVRDEVEEYLVSAGGSSVRLALSGPVGADNVDAYRTMSRSLRLR